MKYQNIMGKCHIELIEDKKKEVRITINHEKCSG